MVILLTGAAGFIGYHLTLRLLKEGINVVGVDNINSYYDRNLKLARIKEINKNNYINKGVFKFIESSIENKTELLKIFNENPISYVVNLAAQAGVRYSIENPDCYINSNIVGFFNILECCRKFEIKHLIYASSSSVYGNNEEIPFLESNSVNEPISLYAATKKSNEVMAFCYSHLYSLPSTGLRFFTVYGPWGRPDMALFLFTKSILMGESIKIFNNGDMSRDFTYIDDCVESIFRVIFKKPESKNGSTSHQIFNIGNSKPTSLMEYIQAIEEELGIKAKKEFLPMQPGDVKSTFADTSLLQEWINFKPSTSIKYGISKFINWYKEFYNY